MAQPSPDAGEEDAFQWAEFDVTETNAANDSYIHRVPEKLRFGNEDKYVPHIVSIGPYHRTKGNVQVLSNQIKEYIAMLKILEEQGKISNADMLKLANRMISDEIDNAPKWQVTENLKRKYLDSLIKRHNREKTEILPKMVEEVKNKLEKARKCYSEIIELTDDEFVQMLIVDGGFILELLYKYDMRREGKLKELDIIFNNKWVLPLLTLDLVLLENQIPFFVLEKLFALLPAETRNPIQHNKSQGQSSQHTIAIPKECLPLNKLIMNFFGLMLPLVPSPILPGIESHHLLDFLRYLIVEPSPPPTTPTQPPTTTPTQLPPTTPTPRPTIWESSEKGKSGTWEHTTCASDLQNAGVNFKPKETSPKGLLDVTFENRKFEIPPFHFGKAWTTLFPNMVALEQCRGDYNDRITSYALLIDNLINSEKDVEVLRDNKIINSQEEAETISHDVNSLFKGVVYKRVYYYDGMCNRVNKFRGKTAQKWRAYFVQNYWHTPWGFFSLCAAFILLALAATQTGLAIKDAVKGK